ncbi:MAG: type II CAAX endopeptidase family protein [Acidobacteriota bacterium]
MRSEQGRPPLARTRDGVPPDPPEGPSEVYRAAWVFYLLVAIVGVVWLGFEADGLSWALFVPLDPARAALDVAIGLAAGLLLVGAWSLGRRLEPLARLERSLAERFVGVRSDEAVGLALLSGFSEELLFRGAMQMSWGPLAALAVFAVLHSGPPPLFPWWTLFALIAGGLFAALAAWRGALLAPMLAHATVNGIHLVRMVRVAEESAEAAGEDTAR